MRPSEVRDKVDAGDARHSAAGVDQLAHRPRGDAAHGVDGQARHRLDERTEVRGPHSVHARMRARRKHWRHKCKGRARLARLPERVLVVARSAEEQARVRVPPRGHARDERLRAVEPLRTDTKRQVQVPRNKQRDASRRAQLARARGGLGAFRGRHRVVAEDDPRARRSQRVHNRTERALARGVREAYQRG
eukprot:CAMPEP_0180018654 /NCGR_PEP_ID=MMETSP0984-20121128/20609_1 /TAXON_ID=483367 /ORGANISM="non described non described, Strain CCMP 2436" /LENGTH=190 /DNA_ID=CAMNT_0021941977 /DNA_START=92 /DNA_END=660 /DNA_ORIENTATION=-